MQLKTTFDLRSQMQKLVIRSFDVVPAEHSHLDPSDPNPYFYGEYFMVSSTGEVARATAGSPAYVCISETASPDAQLTKKVPLILGGTFEAKTKLVSPSTLTPGDYLEVGDFLWQPGVTKSGLVKADLTAAGLHHIVGQVLETGDDYITYVGFAPIPVSV